jgi:site-specific DNA-methyltransferase (adenine-specific)
MEANKILSGDALTELKKLPSESISCIMTSPPYWALRDYGIDVETIWDAKDSCEHEWITKERYVHRGSAPNTVHGAILAGGLEVDWKTKDGFCSKCGAWKGQLGLEPTFDLYIKHLCDIFDEAKRVLRKDGTCWVNLGDTYYSISGGKFQNDNVGSSNNNKLSGLSDTNKLKGGDELESKNLCNIPARFSIEMQNRGWILRNVIIWHKPNCMPSSVKDRFTVDFEYIFFFVKSKKYWFETQYEPSQYEDREQRRKYGWHGNTNRGYPSGPQNHMNTHFQNPKAIKSVIENGRNKRAVWRICPKPFKEAHFAVYPEELCETPIKAGCPEFICKKCGKAREKIYESKGTGIDYSNNSNYEKQVPDGITRNAQHKVNAEYRYKGLSNCNCNAGFESGIVLDMFMGAGTTALVSLKQNKRFIGIELQPKYIEIAMKRLKPYLDQTKLLGS